VNLNNEMPVINTICQFLSELNLTITSLIYASTPADLNEAVNTVKSIEAGYKII